MAPPPQQTSSSQPLPPKEMSLFKRVLKCYEQKQYKAGLKFARQILSNPKYSEHGETLSMKGLILSGMGRHEEAREEIKKGLRNDLKSFVCWHVFGLMQRQDKKYDEAIKAYRNALKLDKENLQILRDLVAVQIQMRDFEGFKETRYQLLRLRPTNRPNWVGYAIANHLCGELSTAYKVVGEFLKTCTPSSFDYEYGELALYQNMILQEDGKYQEALNHLDEHSTQICDKLRFLEIKGDLYLKMNRYHQAERIYDQLLSRNPENSEYYRKLEICKGVDNDGDLETRISIYESAARQHGYASAPKTLPLRFLTGPLFAQRLRIYLKEGFRKGLPSLFQNLRSLYADSEKVEMIERYLCSCIDSLSRCSRFPEDLPENLISNNPGHNSNQNLAESPSTLLWVYFYAARHYDKRGNFEKALQYVDKALAHTPTLIDLLAAKARILKHAGSLDKAATEMVEAQSLDTADRSINTKAAKYLLRANRVEEAVRMANKFTRESAPPEQSLTEMQCLWFHLEMARAHKRRGDLGQALRKCHEVDRIFTGIVDDQFDFHTYCLRKVTIEAYIKMMRMENGVRRNRYYQQIAQLAAKIYLLIDSDPSLSSLNRLAEDVSNVQLTDSEKRKIERKKKKKNAKKEAQDQAAQQQQQQKAKPDPDIEPTVLEPLDPQTLLKTDQPLDEGLKFLSPLIELNTDDIEVYLLAFEIYRRKAKILPMLQCLSRSTGLNPGHAQLLPCKVQFLQQYSRLHSAPPDSQNPIVMEILADNFPQLFPELADLDLADEYCREMIESWERQARSWPHLVAVLETKWLMGEQVAEGLQWLLATLNLSNTTEQGDLVGLDWKSALHFLSLIGPPRLEKPEAQKWRADFSRIFAERFSRCSAFAPPTENQPSPSTEADPGPEAKSKTE